MIPFFILGGDMLMDHTEPDAGVGAWTIEGDFVISPEPPENPAKDQDDES